MKIRIFVYTFNWTCNNEVDITDFDNIDFLQAFSDFYLMTDSFEMNYKSVEELKRALETEWYLINKTVLELSFSDEGLLNPCAEMKEIFDSHSGYFVVKDGKVVDVPKKYKDTFMELSLSRLNRMYFSDRETEQVFEVEAEPEDME